MIKNPVNRRPRKLFAENLEKRMLMAVGIWEGEIAVEVTTSHPLAKIRFSPGGEMRIHFTDVDRQNGTIANAFIPGTVDDIDPGVLQPCTTGLASVARTGVVEGGRFVGDDEVITSEYGYVGTFDGEFGPNITVIRGNWTGQYGYEACDYFDPESGEYLEQIDPETEDTLIEYGSSSGTWTAHGDLVGDVVAESISVTTDEVTAVINVNDSDLLVPVDVVAYWVDRNEQIVSEIRRWQVQSAGEYREVFERPGRANGAVAILVVADGPDVHRETSESNNRMMSDNLSTGSTSRPDLRGVFPDARRFLSGPSGETTHVEWVIENGGNATSGNAIHRVYWSVDAEIDASDILMDTFEANLIPPFSESVYSDGKIDVPPGTPFGTYFALLEVDANSTVEESDETNNVRAVPFTVSDVSPWMNPVDRFDVNGDDETTARDALAVLNALGVGRFIDPSTGRLVFRVTPAFSYDVNGDFKGTPLDALQVINRLAQLAESESVAEGHLDVAASVAIDQIYALNERDEWWEDDLPLQFDVFPNTLI